MAHECPDCGRLCHCGGDIDDISFGENVDCKCPCWMEDDDDEEDRYENSGLFEDPDYDLEKPKA